MKYKMQQWKFGLDPWARKEEKIKDNLQSPKKSHFLLLQPSLHV